MEPDTQRDHSGSAAKYHRTVDEVPGTAHAFALAFTGHRRRVLELGCAAGHVSAALKVREHHVVGVEIDPVSAERARSVADSVHTADLDRTPLTQAVPERDFDVVLMGDVLEHLRDPLTVLTEARSMLNPTGFAVLSLPNVAFADVRAALLDGEWTYRDDGLLDATHLRFFTRRSMFELAERAGFVVTEMRRVIKAPGTSNVAPSAPVVSPLVRDLLALDPNASTFVFVAKLEQPNASNLEAAQTLRASLDAEEAAATRLQRELAGPQGAELAALNQSREELVALHNTTLLRAAALPRRIYARLRRGR